MKRGIFSYGEKYLAIYIICIMIYNTNRGDTMMLFVTIILLISGGIMLGVIHMQFSSMLAYEDGKVLAVRLPKWAMELPAICELLEVAKRKEKKELLVISILVLISVLLQLFLLCLGLCFLFLFLSNQILRKTRKEILDWKKEHIQPEVVTKRYVDLNLYQKKKLAFWQLGIVVLLDQCTYMLWAGMKGRQWFLFVLLFHLIVLVFVIVFVSHMPKKTYTLDSKQNEQLYSLKQKSIFGVLWCFCMSDSFLYLGISLWFHKQDFFFFTLVFFFLTLLMLGIAFYKWAQYRKKKHELCDSIHDEINASEEDAYWNIGWFGLTYKNEKDPRWVVPSLNGMQYIFNEAKPATKIITVALLTCAFFFIGVLFGYPAYLDSRHELSEITLNEHSVMVEGAYFQEEIAFDEINYVEYTEQINSHIRTMGLDNGFVQSGTYEYENRGKIKMYIASRHKAYLLLYNKDNELFMIINDDEEIKTKEMYQKLLQQGKGKE